MRTQIRTPLTYADFVRFPDDGLRHEIIGGAHYVTPAPATGHQRLVMRLAAAFYNYFAVHNVGEVLAAPFDTLLSEHDIVEPDVLVVLDDQSQILTEKHAVGAPAIVIEVLSPGTRRRDEGMKLRLYERTGVREYWLVDSAGELVKVYRRGAGPSFEPVRLFTADGDAPITSPLLPGFTLALSALFAERKRRK